MFYVTNIFLVPLVLAVWVLDLYMILAATRWILTRIRTEPASRLCSSLQPFTDALPQAIRKRLEAWLGRRIRNWLVWLVVIVAAMILRNIMVSILGSGQ